MEVRISAREAITNLVRPWDQPSDSGSESPTVRYLDLLDEVLFHADERFCDYKPHPLEGTFAERLYNWLQNLSTTSQKQLLLKSLQWLQFMDDKQGDALYIDAYQRILSQWVIKTNMHTLTDMLAFDYAIRVRQEIAKMLFTSITLSFSFPRFTHINGLTGIPDPIVLGPTAKSAEIQVSAISRIKTVEACIVFEDFVGTGKQAMRILKTLRAAIPSERPIVFVPLVCLESGADSLRQSLAGKVTVRPVMIIKTGSCIRSQPTSNESADHTQFRVLVDRTAKRVMRRYSDVDDQPESAFGYKDSGALYVSSHNTPNNSLPLIHHRAEHWNPLFRRHHHEPAGSKATQLDVYKDGLR